MKKSFGLFFYLKKPKGYRDGDIPVYLRITVNGRAVDISTKSKYDPLKWNAAACRAAGKTDAAKSLNAFAGGIAAKGIRCTQAIVGKQPTGNCREH